jgi:hypothetical protein
MTCFALPFLWFFPTAPNSQRNPHGLAYLDDYSFLTISRLKFGHILHPLTSVKQTISA